MEEALFLGEGNWFRAYRADPALGRRVSLQRQVLPSRCEMS